MSDIRPDMPAEKIALVAVRLAMAGPGDPTGTFQDENGIVPW